MENNDLKMAAEARMYMVRVTKALDKLQQDFMVFNEEIKTAALAMSQECARLMDLISQELEKEKANAEEKKD
jgi:hypothetical protein